MEAMRIVTGDGVRALQVLDGPLGEADTQVVPLGEQGGEPTARPSAVWRSWARRQLVGAHVEAMRTLLALGVPRTVASQALAGVARAGDQVLADRPRGAAAEGNRWPADRVPGGRRW